jgi:hypothetical protein
MFVPVSHCHCHEIISTTCAFADGMRWAAAFIVEQELQEARIKQQIDKYNEKLSPTNLR